VPRTTLARNMRPLLHARRPRRLLFSDVERAENSLAPHVRTICVKIPAARRRRIVVSRRATAGDVGLRAAPNRRRSRARRMPHEGLERAPRKTQAPLDSLVPVGPRMKIAASSSLPLSVSTASSRSSSCGRLLLPARQTLERGHAVPATEPARAAAVARFSIEPDEAPVCFGNFSYF